MVGELVAVDLGADVGAVVTVALPVSAPFALVELAQPAMDAITKNEASASVTKVKSLGLRDGQR